MCVAISLGLFLKPVDMLGRDGEISKEDVLELATDLHNHLVKTADILERLLEDGWSASLDMYDIECSPPQALTFRQAKARLRKLDIDPRDVDIREDEYEDDDGDEQRQEAEAVAPPVSE